MVLYSLIWKHFDYLLATQHHFLQSFLFNVFVDLKISASYRMVKHSAFPHIVAKFVSNILVELLNFSVWNLSTFIAELGKLLCRPSFSMPTDIYFLSFANVAIGIVEEYFAWIVLVYFNSRSFFIWIGFPLAYFFWNSNEDTIGAKEKIFLSSLMLPEKVAFVLHLWWVQTTVYTAGVVLFDFSTIAKSLSQCKNVWPGIGNLCWISSNRFKNVLCGTRMQ